MIDEMGIKTSFTNPDNNVPEAERNKRLTKDRFRIAYYWFPYKKIPRIMIHCLEMNVTLNLNVFSAKGGVLAYYTPHIVLSQKNGIITNIYRLNSCLCTGITG